MPETTMNTESTRFRETTILYFSRGPMLVVAVITSLLFPCMKEYLTTNVLIHLAIASLGLFWMLRDLSTILESTTRSGLNLVLESIILDDVLRAIYDPITGLYACCVGTYVGASSMYGLNMDEAQRTELVQSSLGLENAIQAHSVLLEPGGCKRLLPKDVQKWLQYSQKDGKGTNRHVAESTNVIDSSWSEHLEIDKSANDSDILESNTESTCVSEESSSDIDEQRITPRHERLDSSFEDDRRGPSCEPKPQRKQEGDAEWMKQADPTAVFFRILQDMARRRIKTCAEGLDRYNIENVGIAAVVAIGIQFALLRSSKKSRLLAKLCAGIATLSFGTILSREAILGNVYDKRTLKMFGRDLATRILNKIKEKSSSNRSAFAMLVLFIINGGRKQVAKGFHAKGDFVDQ